MDNNQVEMKINLELNLNDTNIVISALRELPHRISDDVLRKVVMQAQSQTQQQQQQPDGFQSPPPAFYSKQ
jgi:hypothetical protein